MTERDEKKDLRFKPAAIGHAAPFLRYPPYGSQKNKGFRRKWSMKVREKLCVYQARCIQERISWDLETEALIKLREGYLLAFSMKIWGISLPIFIGMF